MTGSTAPATPPATPPSGPVKKRAARLEGLSSLIALPLISIVLGLLVGAVVMILSQLVVPGRTFNPMLPVEAYLFLFQGAFGSFDNVVRTLVASAPLVLGGLSVGIGFKAGLFNIGAQGQFLVGSLAAVAFGVTFRTADPLIAMPIAVVAGMVAGALWGFIPGFLKAVSGAHEVVTTIMLNYVAVSLLAALVSGPLKISPLSPSPVTADVGNAGLPIIIGSTGHLGIVFAILAAVFVGWLLYRTTRGFEIRVAGANPDAGRYAGMRPRLIIIYTMSIAGMLAGLAGTIQLLGVSRSMSASYGTTVGFDSIAVALLGRSNPLGIVFAALLFGSMRAGSALMQQSVPRELVDVVQATILLFLVAAPVLLKFLRLRGAKEAVGAPETITRTYGGGESAVR